MSPAHIASAALLALAACSAPSNAPSSQDAETAATAPVSHDGYETVTLTGFECGDNCYVEIIETDGDAPELVLCTADICWGDWQAEGVLPAELANTTARAKFGTADQVDNSGNVMEADMRAVIDLRLIEED